MTDDRDPVLAELPRILAALEDGRLIAEGWDQFKIDDHPHGQDMFFAGAHYCLQSVLVMLLERNALSAVETARLQLIAIELHEYSTGLRERVKLLRKGRKPPEGSR